MNEDNTAVRTRGGAAIRYDDQGTLYVGIAPIITQHFDREEEFINAQGEEDVRGVGESRPILDMQPSIVSSSDLISALIEQNDAGKVVEFLGHVRVMPTNVDSKINLT